MNREPQDSDKQKQNMKATETLKRGDKVQLNIPPARPIRLLSGVLHEAGQTYRVLGFHASLVRLSRVGDSEKIMVLPQDTTLVESRKPAFDMAEVNASRKSAAAELIAFGEAEGRRLAMKD